MKTVQSDELIHNNGFKNDWYIYLGPAAPYNLKATPTSNTDAILEWSPGDDSILNNYYIRWVNVNDPTDTAGTYGPGDQTTYNLYGLKPGATYSFNVAATNQDGASPFSEPATFTLGQPQPGNSNCFHCSWFMLKLMQQRLLHQTSVSIF